MEFLNHILRHIFPHRLRLKTFSNEISHKAFRRQHFCWNIHVKQFSSIILALTWSHLVVIYKSNDFNHVTTSTELTIFLLLVTCWLFQHIKIFCIKIERSVHNNNDEIIERCLQTGIAKWQQNWNFHKFNRDRDCRESTPLPTS